MKKVLSMTFGEVSALQFKVNQIWNTPDAIAGIQIIIENIPAIEAQFKEAFTNLIPCSWVYLNWFKTIWLIWALFGKSTFWVKYIISWDLML